MDQEDSRQQYQEHRQQYQEPELTVTQSTKFSLAILISIVGAALWTSREIGGLDKRLVVLEERLTAVVKLQEDLSSTRSAFNVQMRGLETEYIRLLGRVDSLETRMALIFTQKPEAK